VHLKGPLPLPCHCDHLLALAAAAASNNRPAGQRQLQHRPCRLLLQKSQSRATSCIAMLHGCSNRLSKLRLVIITSGRSAEGPVQTLQDATVANTKAGDKPAAEDERKASTSKVHNTGMHAETNNARLQHNASVYKVGLRLDVWGCGVVSLLIGVPMGF
jgi:hypothetical protein